MGTPHITERNINSQLLEVLARSSTGIERSPYTPEATAHYEHAWQRMNGMGKDAAAASDADLAKAAKNFIQKLRAEPDHEGYRLVLLALAREQIYRVSGKQLWLNPVQVFAVMRWMEDGSHIGEIKTGEGKTITFALAAFMEAAMGKHPDVMTTRGALASEGAHEFNKYFQNFGIRAAVLPPREASAAERQKAYAAPVVYGDFRDAVFDAIEETYYGRLPRGQRAHESLLLDEADHFLLDDTNAYQMGTSERKESAQKWLYIATNRFMDAHPDLKPDDTTWQETYRNFLIEHHPQEEAYLREWDSLKLEELLSSAREVAFGLVEGVHYVKQPYPDFSQPGKPAYKATIVDKDKSGELKDSSRWSRGIHQMLHARLGFPVEDEMISVPSMSAPSFIRKYNKLVGISGTLGSETELYEMQRRYGASPDMFATHRPSQRSTATTILTPATQTAHFAAILEDLNQERAKGRPTLLAFATISEVRDFDAYLRQHDVKDFQRLDGLTPAEEQETIARAGKPGAITLTTIIGGRGIDIKPNPEAKANGGLHVIQAFVADSSRVREQIHGRSGRQGAPGSARIIVREDQLGVPIPPNTPPAALDQLIHAIEEQRVAAASLARFRQDFETEVMERYAREFGLFGAAFRLEAYEQIRAQIDRFHRDDGSGKTILLTTGSRTGTELSTSLSNGNRAKIVADLAQGGVDLLHSLRHNIDVKNDLAAKGERLFDNLTRIATATWDGFAEDARRHMERYFTDFMASHQGEDYQSLLEPMKAEMEKAVAPLWESTRTRMLQQMNDAARDAGLSTLLLKDVLNAKSDLKLSLEALKEHPEPVMRMAEQLLLTFDRAIGRIASSATELLFGQRQA